MFSEADVAQVVDEGLSASGSVRKLLHAMAGLGCNVDRSFFHVLRCSAVIGGGFAPEHGVILCHNHLHTRTEVLNAMNHELIHAYDHCRYGGRLGVEVNPPEGGGSSPVAISAGKGDDGGSGGDGMASPSPESHGQSGNGSNSQGQHGASEECGVTWDKTSHVPQAGSADTRCGGDVDSGGSSARYRRSEVAGAEGLTQVDGMDWSNCRHHACSEIRAANLSGDCSLMQELMNGNLPMIPLGWAAQQRKCVARRAALSVAMNPACSGPDAAAAVVSELMPACLADTAPFEPSEAVATP